MPYPISAGQMYRMFARASVDPSPIPVNGLVLHFDAADIDLANGATIDSWGARVGNRTFLSYDGMDAPPMLIVGGRKYVHIGSRSSGLTGMTLDVPFALSDPCTVIFVLRQSVALGPLGGTAYSHLLTNGGWGDLFAALGRQGTGGQYAQDVLYVNDSGGREFGMTVPAVEVAANTPFMLAAAIKGSDDVPDFYLNKQPASGWRTPYGNGRTAFSKLGALPGQQQHFEVDVQAILYYNRVLDVAEVEQIHQYYFAETIPVPDKPF